MSTDVVVSVDHLRKTYGPVTAVADVSLTVHRSEIFGILGPNGAGKTTTVECLAGLRPIDGGTVRVLGLDPHRQTREIRERVGVQLQEARLPAQQRVAEALELYASFYTDPADPGELLRLLGLTSQYRTAFGDLSGGQQQRLSIALALVGNPEIAILDELTTGLDPQARRTAWGLVEEVRTRGVTVLLVTHFMDEAERLCDRLAIIKDGTVVAAGSPQELTAGPPDSGYTVRVPATGSEAVAAVAAALPDVVVADGGRLKVAGGPAALATVLTMLAARGVTPDDVRASTRSLDDLFVELAQRPPDGGVPTDAHRRPDDASAVPTDASARRDDAPASPAPTDASPRPADLPGGH